MEADDRSAATSYPPAFVACKECVDWYHENFSAVLHACASVGIEHGLTTEQAARIYMEGRHALHA